MAWTKEQREAFERLKGGGRNRARRGFKAVVREFAGTGGRKLEYSRSLITGQVTSTQRALERRARSQQASLSRARLEVLRLGE